MENKKGTYQKYGGYVLSLARGGYGAIAKIHKSETPDIERLLSFASQDKGS